MKKTLCSCGIIGRAGLGFTLVELLVVIAIIAILAGLLPGAGVCEGERATDQVPQQSQANRPRHDDLYR